MIHLIAELRELLPDLLARIRALRTSFEAVAEEARRLEEATDCMPAAERGRQQRS